MFMSKLQASLYRDVIEFTRNMSLFINGLLPILVALLFTMNQEAILQSDSGRFDGERMNHLQTYMVVTLALMSISMFNISTAISEEYEKKNVEFYITTNTDYLISIVSKTIIYATLSIVFNVVCLIILNMLHSFSWLEYLGMLNMLVIFTLFGISVGLVIKTVAAQSLFILPVMVFIVLIPLGEFSTGFQAEFQFISQFMLIYQNIAMFEGDALRGVLGHFAYLIFAIALLSLAIRKRVFKPNA